MPRSILPSFLWLAISLPVSVHAASFSGVVSGVPSGERIEIHDGKGRLHTVRLHAIAAPAEGQPYHDAAQKALQRLALQRKVWVDWFQKKDGAEVGKVFRNGDDLAIRLLQRGAVWYDHRQASDQSVADRGLYEEAQEDARRKHLGLWRDTHAVEPWLWRRAATRAVAAIALGQRRAAGKKSAPRNAMSGKRK